MPVHDWTRVLAGTFHHFHQAWLVELSNALNAGLLPRGFYALAEQVAGDPHPDVLTLDAFDEADVDHSDEGPVATATRTATSKVIALADHPPRVRYTLDAEESIYAAKAGRLGIYHSSGDRVVAFIEIVSPGNKHSALAVQQFLEKLARALQSGHHVLLIDLFPPGGHDPQGLHGEFWGKVEPGITADQPLALVAYRANSMIRAFLEPTAVGRDLLDMPLFLTPSYYIYVPLEPTYQAAWRGVPDRWKRVIESPAAPSPPSQTH